MPKLRSHTVPDTTDTESPSGSEINSTIKRNRARSHSVLSDNNSYYCNGSPMKEADNCKSGSKLVPNPQISCPPLSYSAIELSNHDGNGSDGRAYPRHFSESATNKVDRDKASASMWAISRELLKNAARARRGSLYVRAMSIGAAADFVVHKLVPASPARPATSLGRQHSTSKISTLSDLMSDSFDSDDTTGGAKALPPLTTRQKLTIVMLCLANLSSCIVFSCIAPFFPQEASDKDVSSTVQGFIFGIFELAIFVSSPFFGKYILVIGPKFMFTTGLMVSGAAQVLFGFLNLCPPGLPFIALCFAVRVVQAVGTSSFTTASFSIVANEFPGRTGSIIGWLETCNGFGYMGGPTIGGLLYSLGGFQLPFLVLGAILILAGMVSYPLLRGLEIEDEPSAERGSTWRMLAIPSMLVMLLSTGISTASLAFLDPTLQPYLGSQFKLSPFFVGLFFLITSVVYTISSPVVGWFVDRKGHGKLVMLFGTVVMVVSFLFAGPSPFFGLKPTLGITGVAMGLLGIGIGTQLIPPFTQCLAAAKDGGFADNFQTFGMVSGLFTGASSLGSFIGPTFGGWLAGQLGFAYAATVMAGLHLGLLAILSLFLAVIRFRHTRFCQRQLDYNPLD